MYMTEATWLPDTTCSCQNVKSDSGFYKSPQRFLKKPYYQYFQFVFEVVPWEWISARTVLSLKWQRHFWKLEDVLSALFSKWPRRSTLLFNLPFPVWIYKLIRTPVFACSTPCQIPSRLSELSGLTKWQIWEMWCCWNPWPLTPDLPVYLQCIWLGAELTFSLWNPETEKANISRPEDFNWKPLVLLCAKQRTMWCNISLTLLTNTAKGSFRFIISLNMLWNPSNLKPTFQSFFFFFLLSTWDAEFTSWVSLRVKDLNREPGPVPWLTRHLVSFIFF